MSGAKVPAATLPNANESNWLGAYDSHDRALAKMRSFLDARRPVWWRRDAFPKGPYRNVEPKWHVFASRTTRPGATYRADVVWSALCGYSREANENIFGLFQHRVGTPKLADRCTKCDAALKQIMLSSASR